VSGPRTPHAPARTPRRPKAFQGHDPGLDDLLAAPRARRRPKDIGTAGETAVVRYLRVNGWPNAERRALHGSTDLGDVTGCPSLTWEVKAGAAAHAAQPANVETWMAQTELERENSGADVGVLVLARKGYGPARAGMWWAVLPLPLVANETATLGGDVWMTLETACRWLRTMGYGERL